MLLGYDDLRPEAVYMMRNGEKKTETGQDYRMAS